MNFDLPLFYFPKLIMHDSKLIYESYRVLQEMMSLFVFQRHSFRNTALTSVKRDTQSTDSL